MRPVIALVLCLCLTPRPSAAQLDDALWRSRIADERRAAGARLEREQADCRQQFALNRCLDEARARHRQVEAGLKAQLRSLDERRRVERAAARQAEVARKQQLIEQRAAVGPGMPQSLAVAQEPEAPAASASSPTQRTGRTSKASTAAAAASERAAAARRLQAEIKADQQRIEARLARREAQGKKNAPLPAVPGASARPQ